MKTALVSMLFAAASPAALVWGPILARHRFELGVYAFLPDASFRHNDGARGKVDGPTHYLNLDAPVGEAAPEGTVDRRIAQFLELAHEQLKDVRAPKGDYLRDATAEGDASTPYHATKDFNRHAQGEGGIHFYFESDCVNALEPGLALEVLAAARLEGRSPAPRREAPC